MSSEIMHSNNYLGQVDIIVATQFVIVTALASGIYSGVCRKSMHARTRVHIHTHLTMSSWMCLHTSLRRHLCENGMLSVKIDSKIVTPPSLLLRCQIALIYKDCKILFKTGWHLYAFVRTVLISPSRTASRFLERTDHFLLYSKYRVDIPGNKN